MIVVYTNIAMQVNDQCLNGMMSMKKYIMSSQTLTSIEFRVRWKDQNVVTYTTYTTENFMRCLNE